ncbi:putative replication protein A2 [Neospora caninum Liverpool]|uniref:Putative replication protein A2 n=1 Tax=Neospora caninum (strain Liverpool) TaxID=572307 RepID=F0V963_NEOCL|nr:putative replication protein A2 [Neospora caninum Liverpool]CBZ50288.1 putative replication protein A2 [Neospora caninum Liverpool]CEL64893.1 TPA: replication protein A2, putative [Neospora caninum Liverpool]|eukprot:XP_003880322.1 putative replication protein A2 [Neospora caninum Liverpool]
MDFGHDPGADGSRQFGRGLGGEFGDEGGFGGGAPLDAFGGGFQGDGGFLATGDPTGAMFGTGDFDGGGFLMHAGAGATQPGAMPSHQQNTFMPVKIGAVMNAFAEKPDESAISLAPPPAPPLHLLRIIGRVSRVSGHLPEASAGPIDYSAGRACFELEDGTGVVDCEWLLGDDITPYKQKRVEAALQVNNYVRVYGQMSTLGQAVPMLRVHAVRPVTSAGDLLFHEADCCSAFVKIKFFGQQLPDPLEAQLPVARGPAGSHASAQKPLTSSALSPSHGYAGR